MSIEDASARLLAMEDIRQLKCRYFRYMDTKNWSGLETVFTAGAVFDAREAFGTPDPSVSVEASAAAVLRSRKMIVAAIQAGCSSSPTVHHGHCHEIEIIADAEARGVVAMEDRIWSEDGARLILHGYGHYHEIYRREDGQWRIAETRITRLHLLNLAADKVSPRGSRWPGE